MAYIYASVGGVDDSLGRTMCPIFATEDDEPIGSPPSIDKIERHNPTSSAGSGDVLITHQYGVMDVTGKRIGSSKSITPTGELKRLVNYANFFRCYYYGGFWVYQKYSSEYLTNSSRRWWQTNVIRNIQCPKQGNYWRIPPITTVTQSYTYKISNDDHPYDQWPEDVMSEQLSSAIAKAPAPIVWGDYIGSSNVLFQVNVSTTEHYLDPYDVSNYWRGRCFDYPGGYSSRFNGGFVQAYYSAVSKLPQLEQNLFQNILETVSVIKSLADGLQVSDLTEFRQLKKTAQDSWLAYRYQYLTTTSDIKELVSTCDRLYSLLNEQYVHSYGIGYIGNITCHCAITVDMGFYISNMKTYLDRLNLRPTLYNMWDMVPYSFVVDWFLNIGDLLHSLQQWLDAPTFPVTDIWYSFYTSASDEEGARTEIYGRWRGSAPQLPYIDVASVSNRTLLMRIADTVSLFL